MPARHVLLAVTFAAVAPLAAAQLADLQPGRNYPTSDEAFGADHSENAELGDVDLDGDLDVVVANGGDAGPRSNRIFINQRDIITRGDYYRCLKIIRGMIQCYIISTTRCNRCYSRNSKGTCISNRTGCC